MSGSSPPLHAQIFNQADRLTRSMRRLDFLIAGVQKGGTTALSTSLRQHPGVFIPKKKELHFFDNERVDWAQPDYTPLQEPFAGADRNQKLGEATPIYTYWQPSAGRIFAYNPAIRLIVLLRNPVERAYSHWAMEVTRKREPLSFAAAIRDGRQRVSDQAEVGGCHRRFSYVERGFYSEQIERLLSYFPNEQLLFLATENLWRRHAATLAETCTFLGVDQYAVLPQREYVTPIQRSGISSLEAAERDYLKDLYHDDIRRTEQLTALDLSIWLTSTPDGR